MGPTEHEWERWLERLYSLRRDKRGPHERPHKPVLPLSIIDLLDSGLRFILDRSRINVAISRAKCLAIVAGDPRIANSAAGSIGEMMLLNLYCKLVKNVSSRVARA